MTLTPEQLQRATQAKSDQLNGCDLLGGPIVARILDVRSGSSEQPVVIDIDSWPQPWKPSKTSVRVMCACWGGDPGQWIGRYAVLYCKESVRFGSDAVGGIRTSHLSHINETKKIAVNAKRGKKTIEIVEPYYPAESQAPAPEPVYWPDEALDKRLAAASPKLKSGELTPIQVIEKLEKKAPLTAGQKARIERESVPVAEPVEDIGEPPTYEDDDPFSA